MKNKVKKSERQREKGEGRGLQKRNGLKGTKKWVNGKKK